jgi:hypothetical protein
MTIMERVRRGLSPLLSPTAREIVWAIANGKPADESSVARVLPEWGEAKLAKTIETARQRIEAAATVADARKQQPQIDKAEREHAAMRKSVAAEVKGLEDRIAQLQHDLSASNAKFVVLAGDVGGRESRALHVLRSTADPEIKRSAQEISTQINAIVAANTPTPLEETQYRTAVETVENAPAQIKQLKSSGTSESLTRAALLSAKAVTARKEIEAYREKEHARAASDGEIAKLRKQLERREADILDPKNFRIEL